MVYDETSQTYKRRWGHNKANSLLNQDIVLHKDGDDTQEDPWSKEIRESKEKGAWNKNKQINNLQEAIGDRLPGTIDLPSAIKASTKKNS
eukprot:UN03013